MPRKYERKADRDKYIRILPVGLKGGYGFNKKRGLWYISYRTLKEGELVPTPTEKVYLEDSVTTREEARAERDKTFTRWLLEGKARWAKKKLKADVKAVRAKKKIAKGKILDKNPDACLTKVYVKKLHWRVDVDKEYIGTFADKAEARRARNAAYIKFEALRCRFCGQRPERPYVNDNTQLIHNNPECNNHVEFRTQRITPKQMVELWNTVGRHGKFPIKGLITMNYLKENDYLTNIAPE